MHAYVASSRFFLGACMFAALLGCNQKDDIATVTQVSEPLPIASVTFNVIDARTGEPIKGAEILFLDGPKAVSREDGSAMADSIEIGNHIVKTSLEGYETAEDIVEISSLNGEKAVPRSAVKSIVLHKRGVSISGRALLRPKDSKTNLRAMKGLIVELRLAGNFANPFRTTQTSDNGEYEFMDLPENAACSLSILPVEESGNTFKLFGNPLIPADLAAGTHYRISTSILDYLPKGNLVMLSPAKLDIQAGEPVKIVFSAAIDTAQLPSGAVQLMSNKGLIATSYTWEDDNSILSLQPFQADWSAAGSLSVVLTGFRDRNGALLQENGIATGTANILLSPEKPKGAFGQVDSLWVKSTSTLSTFPYNDQVEVDTNAVDYSTSAYTLAWHPVQGAVQYEVYTRESARALWVLSGISDSDTTYRYSSLDNPAVYKPMTRQHMVLARNGIYRGDISKAFILSLRDGVGPVWGPNSTLAKVNSLDSFDNSDGTTPKVVLVKLTLRNIWGGALEPLDHERGPTFRIVRQLYYSNYTPAISKFTWITGSSALIELTIEAGRNGTGNVLVCDLSGMQDISGNPLSSLYGSPNQQNITMSTY